MVGQPSQPSSFFWWLEVEIPSHPPFLACFSFPITHTHTEKKTRKWKSPMLQEVASFRSSSQFTYHSNCISSWVSTIAWAPFASWWCEGGGSGTPCSYWRFSWHKRRRNKAQSFFIRSWWVVPSWSSEIQDKYITLKTHKFLRYYLMVYSHINARNVITGPMKTILGSLERGLQSLSRYPTNKPIRRKILNKKHFSQITF